MGYEGNHTRDEVVMNREDVQQAVAEHAERRRTVRVDVAILYEQILDDADAQTHA